MNNMSILNVYYEKTIIYKFHKICFILITIFIKYVKLLFF